MPHLFGPVASRRLGRSLGVDLVPYKTCSLDCIYCECGPTTEKTVTRREYVPLEEIVQELRAWLDDGGSADYITLAGSGEPTLHSRLGELVDRIKLLTRIPVCILTNGFLLSLPDVRQACSGADLVIPSLDAPDAATFQAINRPHPDISFDAYLEGLRVFARAYTGELWLEVFLVPGVNDGESCVRRIAAIAAQLEPAKIQLNTAVRPTAVASVHPVPEERLRALARLFTPQAELIARFGGAASADVAHTCDHVLALLQRRPCTLQDIVDGLGMPLKDARICVERLRAEGAITTEQRQDQTFYRSAPANPADTH